MEGSLLSSLIGDTWENDPRTRELADLVRGLRVVLSVRTSRYNTPLHPSIVTQQRTKAAFDNGYEKGWRNRAYSDAGYTSDNHRRAVRLGYEQGQKDSEAEINRLVSLTK